ncbi:hypothetical protein NDU88_005822 [Pleurodeles waltl]|uniref:Uncharacterized protein n=1 Tax=Pleurodeles waltl TaxID=8319 RepID=A0AAV7UL25_PLEWA|nr:hypothetical protein NDU88_005822 [Pleurodeles waltl]
MLRRRDESGTQRCNRKRRGRAVMLDTEALQWLELQKTWPPRRQVPLHWKMMQSHDRGHGPLRDRQTDP